MLDSADETEVAPAVGVAFPAGNDDFRAARDRCAQACRRFNETPEDSPGDVRSSRFLDIIRPGRDRSEDAASAVTHDMTFRNPGLKAQTPFVKPPFYVDYGLRVRIGGSTFINRSCMIMDTPVADVIIGERCNIGPNCCIVSVGHALRAEERSGKQSSIGKPITIGDHVWIGANVTVLGGVTIGNGAVIGAGSVITRDIPPLTMALGVPARVVQDLNDVAVGSADYNDTVNNLSEAMRFGRHLDRREELELSRLNDALAAIQRKKAQQQQQQQQQPPQPPAQPRHRKPTGAHTTHPVEPPSPTPAQVRRVGEPRSRQECTSYQCGLKLLGFLAISVAGGFLGSILLLFLIKNYGAEAMFIDLK